ncbi:MAG: dicarboxylate/amino acid:cation symporter [Tumebacillaceae bacterium]
MKRSTQIFVGMGLGILAGLILNLFFPNMVPTLDKYLLVPVGKIFLKLIGFLVVPTVVFSLIVGMGSIGDAKTVGRYSAKLLLLYVVTGVIAVAVGLGAAALFHPGQGVDLVNQNVQAKQGVAFLDWLIGSVPDNPFASFASGGMIQVILSAVLIGVGIVLSGEKGKPVYHLIESANHVTLAIMEFLLKLAPIGVFALMTSVVATQGWGVMKSLSLYVLGLIVALLFMGGGVYSLLLLLTGNSPLHFWKSFTPAFGIAFATSSSNATLPVAMENARERFGLSKEITSFALPFGTTLKKDGAAILQGFNAIFVAQLFGLNLSASQMVAVFVTTIIVSFSTAGVPGAGIIMMTTVLTAAGLPLEGIALVAGVDRLTDIFRTTLNVVSNTANAVILQKWEGKKSS